MEYLVNKTKSFQHIARRAIKPGFGLPMSDIRVCELSRIDFSKWEIVGHEPKPNTKFRAKLGGKR